MKVKTILVFVVIAGLLVGGIYALNKYGSPEKRKLDMATFLAANGMSDINSLLQFDAPFITAWYKAAKRQNKSFDYNGKTYCTKTGRAITELAPC